MERKSGEGKRRTAFCKAAVGVYDIVLYNGDDSSRTIHKYFSCLTAFWCHMTTERNTPSQNALASNMLRLHHVHTGKLTNLQEHILALSDEADK